MIYHSKFIAVLLGMPFSELNINRKRVAVDTSYEEFQAFLTLVVNQIVILKNVY